MTEGEPVASHTDGYNAQDDGEKVTRLQLSFIYVEAGEKAMRLGVIGHSWEGAGGERKDMVHGKGAALRLLLAR
jgi:hypothetical protein